MHFARRKVVLIAIKKGKMIRFNKEPIWHLFVQMQRLRRGHVRLPNFHGKPFRNGHRWHVDKLNQLGMFKKGTCYKKDEEKAFTVALDFPLITTVCNITQEILNIALCHNPLKQRLECHESNNTRNSSTSSHSNSVWEKTQFPCYLISHYIFPATFFSVLFKALLLHLNQNHAGMHVTIETDFCFAGWFMLLWEMFISVMFVLLCMCVWDRKKAIVINDSNLL